ncbi:MAG: hypothetical protein ACON5B_18170 [Myxococcota bacterium]
MRVSIVLVVVGLALSACKPAEDSGPELPDALSKIGSTIVGEAGGQFVLDILTISVPPGAFATNTEIEVYLDPRPVDGYARASERLWVLPLDVTLSMPVEMSFRVDVETDAPLQLHWGPPGVVFEAFDVVRAEGRADVSMSQFGQGFIGLRGSFPEDTDPADSGPHGKDTGDTAPKTPDSAVEPDSGTTGRDTSARDSDTASDTSVAPPDTASTDTGAGRETAAPTPTDSSVHETAVPIETSTIETAVPLIDTGTEDSGR